MAQPDILTIPFAANAAPETINPIPISREPTDPAQQATWSEGFPRVTMQPMATGGIPPKGQDMNGALKAISEHIVYMGSGGFYRWSDAWVAAKGGYPLGAVLQSNDGRSAYVNIVEGNAVNFNTTPSSIGVSWLPFAGNGALSGKVDKTTQVIAGSGLTGGGDLTANRTLSVNYGTTAGTAAQGNDSRIVNSVQTSGTQTIAGVKTFSSFPVTPSAAPTDDYQAANKKYVDDSAIGVGRTWQTVSRSSNVTYTNTSGRTIFLAVRARLGAILVDDIEVGVFHGDIDGRQYQYAIVPPEGTYRITGSEITCRILQ